MSIKTYRLQCEFCNYKKTAPGSDFKELIEIPLAPVPKGLAKRGHIKRPKLYRCPKCGRGIRVKKVSQ
jgi:hypothetical protein